MASSKSYAIFYCVGRPYAGIGNMRATAGKSTWTCKQNGDGILMISYFNLSLDSGMERVAAMVHTCSTQLRPVVMTCIVACVGLLPAAVSTGIGSQVQKPLALVVVGGMLLAPLLIMLVMPVLILAVSRNQPAPPEAERA